MRDSRPRPPIKPICGPPMPILQLYPVRLPPTLKMRLNTIQILLYQTTSLIPLRQMQIDHQILQILQISQPINQPLVMPPILQMLQIQILKSQTHQILETTEILVTTKKENKIALLPMLQQVKVHQSRLHSLIVFLTLLPLHQLKILNYCHHNNYYLICNRNL